MMETYELDPPMAFGADDGFEEFARRRVRSASRRVVVLTIALCLVPVAGRTQPWCDPGCQAIRQQTEEIRRQRTEEQLRWQQEQVDRQEWLRQQQRDRALGVLDFIQREQPFVDDTRRQEDPHGRER